MREEGPPFTPRIAVYTLERLFLTLPRPLRGCQRASAPAVHLGNDCTTHCSLGVNCCNR